MQRLAYSQAAPEAVKALSAGRTYLKTTDIEPRLRALVELRTSQINGCPFCIDTHSREARRADVDQQQLDLLSVWRDTDLFDDRERAALAWTESVTRVAETNVPDEVYEEVKKHFSEKDLVDLTLTVAVMNAWNRLAISFRQNLKPRLDRKGG